MRCRLARAVLLVAVACAAPRARAAGYHFVKVEALAGVDARARLEGGFGVSLFSDAHAFWMTFGDPSREGGAVRAWRLESRHHGPVLGWVPPDFEGLVPADRGPRWALPWVGVRAGGDAATRKAFEADVSGHYVLNVPGFWDVDPRRAHVGPGVGLGLNATWWTAWRGVASPAVMTGKLTAEAGFFAGATARDTWYAQGRATVYRNLFGIGQAGLAAAAVTGVFLDRVVAPVGLELRADLEHGDDTFDLRPATHWSARISLHYKLAPPYRTRTEERIDARRRAAGSTP